MNRAGANQTDHQSIRDTAVERSRCFYEETLSPLGYGLLMEHSVSGKSRPVPPCTSPPGNVQRRTYEHHIPQAR